MLQEGTVSHDTAVQMRVGTGTAVDAGWLSYENVSLRAASEPLPVIGGERYQLTAQIDAQLTMPDSARLLLLTTDGNQTRTETLWTNESGSPNDIVTITHEFYATAGAGIMQVVVEMPLDGGTLALSDLSLGLYVPPPVTRRSTYSLAGQAVAVRVTGDPDTANNGLFYLYSDHPSASSGQALGSASAMTDAAGNPVGDVVRYYPFGDYRTAPTAQQSAISDRGFTGHKSGENGGSNDIGLIYMNARFYVSGIGRFASADTVVPDPANPQSYNRYTYSLNNPINRVDPTGHRDCEFDDYCGPPVPLTPQEEEPIRLLFQAEDWEIQLLTMVVINEIAGQPIEQVEYATWTVLNRYNSDDLQTRSGFESRIESILIGNPIQYHAVFGYDVETETFRGGVFPADLAWTGPLGSEVTSNRYADWLNSQPYATQERIDAVIGVVDAYNSGATDPTHGADTFFHVQSIVGGGSGGAYWAEQKRLAAVADNSPQAAAATGWVAGNGLVRPYGLSMDMVYWKQWGR